MKPLRTFETWPPLVNATGIPLFIRVRDTVLTLAAWAMLGYLLRDALYLAYDYLSHPIFELTTATPPDWAALWRRLRGYALFIAILMAWLVYWGHKRRTTLASTAPQPQPPTLPVEPHARAFYLEPAEVLRWHAARRLVVNFEPDGRIASATSGQPAGDNVTGMIADH